MFFVNLLLTAVRHLGSIVISIILIIVGAIWSKVCLYIGLFLLASNVIVAIFGAIRLQKIMSYRSDDDPEFNDELNICRRQIDQIDAEIFDLLNRRMHTSDKIGEIKKANNVAILQSNRWEDICRRMLTITRRMGLSEEFVRTVLEAIHVESINRQNEIMNK